MILLDFSKINLIIRTLFKNLSPHYQIALKTTKNTYLKTISLFQTLRH